MATSKDSKGYKKALGRIKEARETNSASLNLLGLGLDDNELTMLLPEIGELTALTELNLRDNQLTTLPPEIGKLTALTDLDLDSHQLDEPTWEAYVSGLDALRTYLLSLADAEAVEKLYETKLLLVGEGAVGKSTLVASLNGLPFVEKRSSTHGVHISDFALPRDKGDEQITFNVWDFGGQIVYRVTNQFFYSHRSLFLLLWDPRQDLERCDVEGWIKRIHLRVGDDARIIIVATFCRAHNRATQIDKNTLQERYGDIIAGFHEVDSGFLEDGETKAGDGETREKYGLQGLRDLIAGVAEQLPQMGSPFNRDWAKAQQETLALRDEPENLAYVPYELFLEICGRNGMEGNAPAVLAGLMHDLGHVLYYGRHEGLKHLMILQPEWVTKAIGYILEDPETNGLHGELVHSRLRKLWNDSEDAEKERYDSTLHPFFLRLMELFDVSYRLDEGDSSLVAQLVPDVRPDDKALPWLANTDVPTGRGQIQLNCQMEERPTGLIPWMIVRTHRYATPERLHWKNGMFLRYDGHGEALLEQHGREFRMTARAVCPTYFMAVVQSTLEQLIAERWPGLAPSLPCPAEAQRMANRAAAGLPWKPSAASGPAGSWKSIVKRALRRSGQTNC